MRERVQIGALYALFTLSGFAGLVYEAVWSRYLGLVLGHAAYARTFVLVLFMGGLALGAWLVSREAHRRRRLLAGYAAVEAVLGLAGLGFHAVFEFASDLSYSSVIPALGSAGAVGLYLQALATLLVLPLAVLLGATFPLLAGAVARRAPARRGRALATLYFTNSLGGALGVLVGGFVLVPEVGLPGALAFAGGLNLLVAAVASHLARADARWSGPPPPAPRSAVGAGVGLLLAAAAVTGAASFVYEVAWLRMLSLVLGATTHAFELMLAAFVAGLAFGGLWIRRRIDTIASPLAYLGVVQVVMALAALASLPLYGRAVFDWMERLLAGLARTEPGYVLYNVASHAIALAMMFPTAFCAGMTLPLITHAALERGAGEAGIGRVYAANTVGAIAGVAATVHLLMPRLGVEGAVAAGVALDLGLGVVLLARSGVSARAAGVVAAGGALALALVLAVQTFDPRVLASGVFDRGDKDLFAAHRVEYYRDGRTASVAVLSHPATDRVITTNGKPDAAIGLAPGPAGRTPDEYTMVLLGAVPLAHNPGARRVAVVGFGSGLTTHVLLGAPGIERVDTVEIEPAMIEGARTFGPRVARAFDDPRSWRLVEDARSYFARHVAPYDIVVSEPSTTWVSGVSDLFTREFYRLVRARLAPGGVFAQWLNLRGNSLALVASAVTALGAEFEDYRLYALNDVDLLIVAGARGAAPPDWASLLAAPDLAADLALLGIRTESDLRVFDLGDRATLGPLFDAQPLPPNSDYLPLLDLHGARARFLERTAQAPVAISLAELPVLEMLSGRAPAIDPDRLGPHRVLTRRRAIGDAAALLDAALATGHAPPRAALLRRADLRLAFDVVVRGGCTANVDARLWVASLHRLAGALVPFLPAERLEPLWPRIDPSGCTRLDAPLVTAWFETVRALGRRDGEAAAASAAAALDVAAGRLPGAQVRFLGGAVLLGRLASGDRAGARRAWTRLAGVFGPEPPPHIELLGLHAAAR